MYSYKHYISDFKIILHYFFMLNYAVMYNVYFKHCLTQSNHVRFFPFTDP